MGRLLPTLLVVVMLVLAPSAYSGSKALPKVDLRFLSQHEPQYLGKTVSVHACWVWARPHGEFIHPCDDESHNGKYVILLSYPETGRDFLSDIYIDRLHAGTLDSVEADFVGTLTKETDTIPWGTSERTRIVNVFVLQDVLKPKLFRKH